MCSMFQTILFPLSSILLWFGISGLLKGEVFITGMKKVYKKSSPFVYWIHVILYIVMALFGIFFGFYPELLVEAIRNR